MTANDGYAADDEPIFALNSLGVSEPPPFERLLGTREHWQALGVELTGERDLYGEIALYRGQPTARLWTLDRTGDGSAGMIWGAMPVQGYGVVGGQVVCTTPRPRPDAIRGSAGTIEVPNGSRLD